MHTSRRTRRASSPCVCCVSGGGTRTTTRNECVYIEIRRACWCVSPRCPSICSADARRRSANKVCLLVHHTAHQYSIIFRSSIEHFVRAHAASVNGNGTYAPDENAHAHANWLEVRSCDVCCRIGLIYWFKNTRFCVSFFSSFFFYSLEYISCRFFCVWSALMNDCCCSCQLVACARLVILGLSRRAESPTTRWTETIQHSTYRCD